MSLLKYVATEDISPEGILLPKNCVRGPDPAAVGGSGSVVEPVCRIGRRNELVEICCDRGYLTRRNLVAQKLRAGSGPRGGRGIVNCMQTRCTEVAPQLRRCGYGNIGSEALHLPVAFIACEEKGLVLSVVKFWHRQRAADCPAELVTLELGYGQRKKAPCVSVLVAHKFEKVAVEFVPPRSEQRRGG